MAEIDSVTQRYADHVQVILNGHEFVACAACRQGMPFVQEQNCW